MPKFFSLEQPPKRKVEELVKELEEYSKRKVEELVKELEEYSKLRPFLTFNFPINEDRKKALEMIESGKLDSELLVGLLESNDFVVRLAMFYLLGKIHNLPEQERKKIVEKALSVLEKLAEDEDSWVRGQAALALGNLGEIALPVLKELAKDKDSFVRGQAALALGNLGEIALPVLKELIKDESREVVEQATLALGNLGEIALPVLEELAKDKGFWARGQAIQALGNLGEKALPVLKELIKDESREVVEQAILALGNLGEIALPVLEELAKDKGFWARGQAIQALGNLGEKALPVLKELAKDESFWVRGQAALALGNLGEIALPLLKELAKDKDSFVRRHVAVALGNLGKEALPVLEELANDEDSEVRRQAALALDKIKSRLESKLWLLATKKPLFATPYTKELAERILEIQKIVKEMKDKFGDRFIGIVIFGSTAKGYAKPTSDLDWGIIAKDIEVSDYFEKRAKDIKLALCFKGYVLVDEKTYIARTNIEMLFYGLFFGDRKMLHEIQKNTLESIDPQAWEGTRKIIMNNELDLSKAAERFGIDKKEMERIMVFSALLRVPPTYNEALKIVRRRAGLSSLA